MNFKSKSNSFKTYEWWIPRVAWAAMAFCLPVCWRFPQSGWCLRWPKEKRGGKRHHTEAGDRLWKGRALTSPNSPCTTFTGSVKMSRASRSTFRLNVALKSRAERERKWRRGRRGIHHSFIKISSQHKVIGLTLSVGSDVIGNGADLRFYKEKTVG